MTARRERNKPKPQQNKQLAAATPPEAPTKKGHWKEHLGKYLIDVSKYVLTGVLITSLFSDMKDLVFLYGMGMFIVIWTLVLGLILTNKAKEE